MKKLLCLVLSVVMAFSCFAVCLTASAAEYLYRPEEVSRVIDPIIAGVDTAFGKGIYEIGYKSAESNITKNALEQRIKFGGSSFPADDKMFGVNFDFLYGIDNSAFVWDFCKYELVNDKNMHINEIKQAELDGKKSTCQMKGWYDACSAVLYGYEYDYPTKAFDTQIFESIVEKKDTYFNSSTQRQEAHYSYSYFLTKGQFSLMRANSNYLLNKLVKGSIGNGKIYNNNNADANAIKLANFIGHLIYPDFTTIPADTKVFDDKAKMKPYTFFKAVTELSRLDDMLNAHWCNTGAFDVRDIMSALGVVVKDEVILDVELKKGEYMGARILTDIYTNFIDSPIGYIANLFQLFSRNYDSLYRKPIEALFSMKFPEVADRSRIAGDKVDSYDGFELTHVDGFINFIVDNIYFQKLDEGKAGTKFNFAPLPTSRLSNASDVDELYLYLLCYFDINRSYADNSSVIDSFINSAIALFNKNYSGENKSTDISNAKTVLNSMFKSTLTFPMIHSFFLGIMTTDVIESFPDNFMSNIKNAIANLIQRFINAMDNFYNILFGWTEGLFDKNK